MTPQRATLVEQAALIVGAALVVAALAAVDWRLGMFTAGLLLCGSAINWRRTS